MKENRVREEKGITLIALVITIIVLIILAGVSIAMLSSDKGVLTRTGEAIARQQIGVAQDKCVLLASEAVEAYYYEVYVNSSATNTAKAFNANELNQAIWTAIQSDTEIPTLGITVAEVEYSESDPFSSAQEADGSKIGFTMTYTDGSSVKGVVESGKVSFGSFTLAQASA